MREFILNVRYQLAAWLLSGTGYAPASEEHLGETAVQLLATTSYIRHSGCLQSPRRTHARKRIMRNVADASSNLVAATFAPRTRAMLRSQSTIRLAGDVQP